MGDWIRRNAVTIFIVAVVFFLLWAISLPNYIRVKGGANRRNLIGSNAATYGAPEMAPASPGYDSEYMGEPMRGIAPYAGGGAGADKSAAESPPVPGMPSSGESTGNGSVVTTALSDAGLIDKLDSWMIPKAYADDHELDERYLVREGDCNLKVDDYKQAADDVSAVARKYEGMVSDSHSSKNTDNTTTGWIKLRVPSEKFFDAWGDILKIGEVTEQNIGTQDVSREYVGYVSRMKNLMAEQATLQNMLDEALKVQRSRGLGEGYSVLLDTQKRLFDVTGQIESTEDQMNALADRITRSTITVNLTEAKKLPEQVKEEFSWGLGTTAGTAYKDLLKNLRGAAQGVVYFIITCWTWLIPWLIVLLILRWIYLRWVKPWLARERAKSEALVESEALTKPKPE